MIQDVQLTARMYNFFAKFNISSSKILPLGKPNLLPNFAYNSSTSFNKSAVNKVGPLLLK